MNAEDEGMDGAATLMPPLSVFHWAFFRLEAPDGQLQLAKRRDMRVFVVVSACVVYLLFLLVAMAFMSGFERIFTMAVCCCAPLFVYLATATVGMEARSVLERGIEKANRQLAEVVQAGDNRCGLVVLQVAATFGRSEALETVTLLIRSYQARPVVDPRAFVDLAELCARDQVILAVTGSARSFRPLLQLTSSWATPVPLIRHKGRVRVESPFTLL